MSEACRHEVHVRRAANEDAWSESLRAHIETCLHCRAAAAVAPVMTTVARVDERHHPLPSATVIWLKAQLMRGNATFARVSRPINIMQIVAYLIVAGGWAAILMFKWNDIERLVMSPAAAISSSASVSLSMLAAVVILGSITFALAMHTILAEE